MLLNYIHRRGFLILGLSAGAIVAIILFVRQDNTNSSITKLRTQVRVINQTSPCTGLTTSECAYKLLRALPREQRESISVSEKTLERLRKRAEAERKRLQNGNAVRGANGRLIQPSRGDTKTTTKTGGSGHAPARTTPSSPPSGGSGGGGSSPSSPSAPASPSQPSQTSSSPPTATTGTPPTSPPSTAPPATTVPTPPSQPSPGTVPPIISTPPITTPPIGPVPPITVPPISVPCIPIKPLITCETRP